MDNPTIENAIDVMRHKILRGRNDEEYQDAFHTLMVLWDDERIEQLNKAVVSYTLYDIEPNTLYILMQPRIPRYVTFKRMEVDD